MVVRVAVKGINSIGRATQGVRVITLKPGDKLMAVANVAAKEEEEAEGEE
jgi:DNA gyrase subunit A